MSSPYPVSLDLRGKGVAVVGGGRIALRKVESLLAAGAQVTVVAPELHQGMEALVRGGMVEVKRRAYRRGDLKGAMLAVGATSDSGVHREMSREAADLRIFLNAVDEPELCSFMVPSVIRRDALTVAICTGGLSPALGKLIRERLEEILVPQYGGFLRLLGGLRARLPEKMPLREQREAFWTDVVNSDAFELYRSRGEAAGAARVEEILRESEARPVAGGPGGTGETWPSSGAIGCDGVSVGDGGQRGRRPCAPTHLAGATECP